MSVNLMHKAFFSGLVMIAALQYGCKTTAPEIQESEVNNFDGIPSLANLRNFESLAAVLPDVGGHDRALTKDSSINWPALPRVWENIGYSKTESEITNIGVLGVIPGLNVKAGHQKQHEIKYSLNSYLKVITHQSGVNQLVVKKKNKKGIERKYFDVSHQPLVAICSYSVRASVSHSTASELSFFGNGKGYLDTEADIGDKTIYSPFFYVKGNIPVGAYVHQVCEGYFNDHLKENALKEVRTLIAASVSWKLRTDTCDPTLDADIKIDKEITAMRKGDASCYTYRKKFAASGSAVPRCELENKDDGSSKFVCNLYSGLGAFCPMFWDEEEKKLHQFYKKGRRRVTSINWLNNTKFYEQNKTKKNPKLLKNQKIFYCDHGLECQLTKKPTLVLGYPIIYGKSVCVKKYPNKNR